MKRLALPAHLREGPGEETQVIVPSRLRAYVLQTFDFFASRADFSPQRA
jgi:hypothetical protein